MIYEDYSYTKYYKKKACLNKQTLKTMINSAFLIIRNSFFVRKAFVRE
ncbi:hypothetical protein GCM10022271_26360 [Corallibacter vietnamensis]|uniref:Uncharacterized protein n=1 Tax=Corallibacter vietnamensis TaxID=904130 RepID=A0ABP7HF45_9FLAO